MTTHTPFLITASIVLILWVIALIGYLPPVAKRLRFPLGTIALTLGWVIMAGYLAWLWKVMERPPMRTLGETFLWFMFFLPPINLFLEWRTRARTIAAIPTVIFAILILGFSALKPEVMDKTMMPALNSPWFAPHVIIYMVSYAALAVACVVALWVLLFSKSQPDGAAQTAKAVEEARLLVYIGFPLMTTGMILGAIWAKLAWGTYWGWDPKETFAFLSWAVYLIYLHLERYTNMTPRRYLTLAACAFLMIPACWLLVNVLPTAVTSAHAYTQ